MSRKIRWKILCIAKEEQNKKAKGKKSEKKTKKKEREKATKLKSSGQIIVSIRTKSVFLGRKRECGS